jgi:alpha-L-arabinofuranosidase
MPLSRVHSRLLLSVSFLLASWLPAAATKAADLTVDVQQPIGKVSPTLYGLMTEEINYSYDGGLYGELIRNRSFHKGWDEPAHWYLTQTGTAQATVRLDDTTGPSTAQPISLRLDVSAADVNSAAGVWNEGYWGIPVLPNATYSGSFFAKSEKGVPVTMRIVSNATGESVASAESEPLTSEWKQYKVSLKTGSLQPSTAYHVVLEVTKPTTVWFDLISLFPPTYKSRENGNRIDIMEKLAAMQPKFLRFPGGNYLEGDHISERFDWKKTIGPLVDRPTHPSPWRYRSSDGMGLLEFLEWCEDLQMQPVLAVYAGYSLLQEHVTPGPDLQPYVQDALDELEYVTGDSNTKWGAVRARNGHPEPFHLTYVEIGNEDEFDKSKSYDGRYAQFFDAIKAKYPQLQLIATTPVTSRKPDVVDDHYYKRADQFFTFVDHYDKVDRNGPKIFVGEWATREGAPTTNFGAALGDAAWMTAMERNSDLIVMASYAPLFVNVNPGGMQWESNLIGYNALTSYGSPSYYAQVMFSHYLGSEILRATVEGEATRLFASATGDQPKGKVYLKVVNANGTQQTVNIHLKGLSGNKVSGKWISLAAKSPADTNTITDPAHITPNESALPEVKADFSHTFAPYSINVLEVSNR